MSNPFDRWAQGPGKNMQQGNYEDWNQMVGSAPPDRFSSAASQVIGGIPPQDYYRHTQPGVDNTDPIGSLHPALQGSIVGSLLSALMNRGLNQNQIQQQSGVPTLDPSQMSPSNIAALLQYAQRQHPDALGQVATQYRSQPGLLQSILGNPALMSIAMNLGQSFLQGQMGQRHTKP